MVNKYSVKQALHIPIVNCFINLVVNRYSPKQALHIPIVNCFIN